MSQKRGTTILAGAALLAQAASAGAAPQAPVKQPVTGPVAVYWMSAATSNGFGGMGGMMGAAGGGGPQRPSMAAMMSMGMGGGPDPNAANHTLVLQLGSSLKPAGGGPTAEHDAPAGLGVGQVLPLLSPEPQTPAKHEEREPGPPPEYQKPHGRMLIFWGCGEHAPPGQPYVIDFAKLDPANAGQMFAGLGRGLSITGMQPPSPGRNTTYGEWPNRLTRVTVPGDASLAGDHVIKGNYSPEIKFGLTPEQDFLPPFRLTTNAKNPSGSATLAWRPVDGAAAYFATLMGARNRDEIVMWTSSSTQTSAFSLPDYLSNGEIRRLVASNALMPASQTSCVIPQEVVAATGQSGMFQLAAYGDETNIAYPPRPPAPKPWNIAWEVKVRYKSTTGGILGMDMSQMGGRHRDSDEPREPRDPNQPPPKKKRPSLFNPLGGLPGLGNIVP